jgi:xylulokinase
MALICFLNGSLAREAVRRRFDLSWEEFGDALTQTPPGNDGALMLPYFAPEIVPRVSRAGVVRRNLAEDDVRGNVRAVIEAQALSSRIHARWMGVEFSSLSVTGGASANTQILQVYADVHGCPVRRYRTTNAAALGAALRACQGEQAARGQPVSWEEVVDPFTRAEPDSEIRPNARWRPVYDRLMGEYEDLERRRGSEETGPARL